MCAFRGYYITENKNCTDGKMLLDLVVKIDQQEQLIKTKLNVNDVPDQAKGIISNNLKVINLLKYI